MRARSSPEAIFRARELELVGLSHERTVAWDRQGRVLWTQDGDVASVKIPVRKCEELAGNICSHNHPLSLFCDVRGGGRQGPVCSRLGDSANYRHSVDDVLFALSWFPAEDRVVFPFEHRVWVARITLDAPIKVKLKQVSREMLEIQERIARDLGIQDGRRRTDHVDPRDLFEADDLLMRATARRFGFTYDRFVIGELP